MRILFITYHFPPYQCIGAIRTGKLAKYWHARGHDVRILSAGDQRLPATLAQEVPESIVHRTKWLDMRAFADRLRPQKAASPLLEARPPQPRGVRWTKHLKALAGFPDEQVGWLPYALREGHRHLAHWRPDLIYASAQPFTGLVAASMLSRRYGIPWVGELRDLWTDNHYRDYPAWRLPLDTQLEDRVLGSAAGLVAVSEPMAEALRRRHRRPTQVVMNGYDPADYPPVVAPAPQSGGLLRLVYTGSLYATQRDPSALFEALSLLGERRERVRIEFYGRLPDLSALAARYGVGHLVSVPGAVTHREALRLQQEADALLLLLWNDAREHGIFSGKLYEYLGARRPILCLGLESGVAAQLLKERQAGVVANRPEAIAAMLSDWLAQKDALGCVPGLSEEAARGLTRAEQFAELEAFLAALRPAAPAATPERRPAPGTSAT